jgi:uncharacterized protein (TIGR02246 family)
MHRFMAMGIAFTLAAQASAAEVGPTDRQQLLQLAQRMDRAWTAGDANANARLFVADATARFGTDPLGEGREAIRQQFEGFFKDRPAGLRHVTSVERIERIAPDFAMWDAEVRVERQRADGRWVALTRIRNVSLVVRQPDGWRIQAVRAFPVSP